MTVISTKIIFLCLLIGLEQFTISTAKIGYIDIMDLLKFGQEIVTDVFESWELIAPRDPESENNIPYVHRMERELKNRISKVSYKLDMYQENLEIGLDTIVAKLLTDLPLQQGLDQRMRRIDEIVGQIDDLYNNFRLFVTRSTKYERYTLEDFAKTCVSSRSGALPDLLKSLHRLCVPNDGNTFSKSVLVMLINEMKINNNGWDVKLARFKSI